MATVGVVIPALDEADSLAGVLTDLRKLNVNNDILVVDGGSRDQTAEVARREGARVCIAPKGRGSQLEHGANQVKGEWLLFLHADVRIPAAARTVLDEALQDPGVRAAVWRLAIDAPGIWFRLIEFGARVRDQLGGLPYGDQGLLVSRQVYEAVGGFQPIPIMEDVALVRKLRREVRLHRLRAPLLVSARRWQREGPVRTWLRNIVLVSAYLAGMSPERLARWYRPEPR